MASRLQADRSRPSVKPLSLTAHRCDAPIARDAPKRASRAVLLAATAARVVNVRAALIHPSASVRSRVPLAPRRLLRSGIPRGYRRDVLALGHGCRSVL